MDEEAEGMIEPESDEGSELCQDPIPGHEPQSAAIGATDVLASR